MNPLVPIGTADRSWNDEERALVPLDQAASIERCLAITTSSITKVRQMQLMLFEENQRIKERTKALEIWREDRLKISSEMHEKSCKILEIHANAKEETLQSMKDLQEKVADQLEEKVSEAEKKNQELEDKGKSLQVEIEQKKRTLSEEAQNGQAIQNSINALRRNG